MSVRVRRHGSPLVETMDATKAARLVAGGVAEPVDDLSQEEAAALLAAWEARVKEQHEALRRDRLMAGEENVTELPSWAGVVFGRLSGGDGGGRR